MLGGKNGQGAGQPDATWALPVCSMKYCSSVGSDDITWLTPYQAHILPPVLMEQLLTFLREVPLTHSRSEHHLSARSSGLKLGLPFTIMATVDKAVNTFQNFDFLIGKPKITSFKVSRLNVYKQCSVWQHTSQWLRYSQITFS